MKTLTFRKPFFFLILSLLVLTIYSCEPKINFEQTKAPGNMTLGAIENVVSYNMRFNPKANATIIITLTNEAEYTAKDLNPSQTSALLALLSEKGLQFDTKNEEFIFNTSSND